MVLKPFELIYANWATSGEISTLSSGLQKFYTHKTKKVGNEQNLLYKRVNCTHIIE